MSEIHASRPAHPHPGPRYSASDRPLPPTEPARTWTGRAWLWASILTVYGLVALAIAAPTATLTVLLAVLVAAVVIAGVFQLADRRARSWSAIADRHPKP